MVFFYYNYWHQIVSAIGIFRLHLFDNVLDVDRSAGVVVVVRLPRQTAGAVRAVHWVTAVVEESSECELVEAVIVAIVVILTLDFIVWPQLLWVDWIEV